jgi:hypothetical protein
MTFKGTKYICSAYKTCKHPCYKRSPFIAWNIVNYSYCQKEIQIIEIANIQWEICKANKKLNRKLNKKVKIND